jgi:hypothetical protein
MKNSKWRISNIEKESLHLETEFGVIKQPDEENKLFLQSANRGFLTGISECISQDPLTASTASIYMRVTQIAKIS